MASQRLLSVVLSVMKISKPWFLIVILLQQILVVNSAHIILKRHVDDKILNKEPLEEKANNQEGVEKNENPNNDQNAVKEEKSSNEKTNVKDEKSSNEKTNVKEEKSNNDQTNRKQGNSNGDEETDTKQENKTDKEKTLIKQEKSSNEDTNKKNKQTKDPTWGANAAAKSDINAEKSFKPTKGKSEWRKPDNDGKGNIDGGERNDEIPDFFADLA